MGTRTALVPNESADLSLRPQSGRFEGGVLFGGHPFGPVESVRRERQTGRVGGFER